MYHTTPTFQQVFYTTVKVAASVLLLGVSLAAAAFALLLVVALVAVAL